MRKGSGKKVMDAAAAFAPNGVFVNCWDAQMVESELGHLSLQEAIRLMKDIEEYDQDQMAWASAEVHSAQAGGN